MLKSLETKIGRKYQRVQLKCDPDRGRTEQSHKKSCDIHTIMRKSREQGVITHVKNTQGQYADLTSRPDFQEAQNTIAKANSLFESVPSHIREKFDNDPGRYLEFVTDSDKRDEMEELGLSTEHLGKRPEKPIKKASDDPKPEQKEKTPPSGDKVEKGE